MLKKTTDSTRHVISVLLPRSTPWKHFSI